MIYLSNAEIKSHFLTSIPGWEGKLPSTMFAGHLPVANKSKFLSYIFIKSQNDPLNSPLVLWMQGGPGSSGFYGLFTELGPFQLNQFSLDGNSIPKLLFNPYSWTQNANFIFFESPAGVGYSYCIDSCPINTDESAAEDAYSFLLQFFYEYPEFSKNEFFIAGESYGGIYVPMLSELIVDRENDINFKGILVGNGCTGYQSIGGCGINSKLHLAQFLHGHAQISSELFVKYNNCIEGKLNSLECDKLFQDILIEVGPFYPYGLYDDCFAIETTGEPSTVTENDYPCYQELALNKWMTNSEVKKIFHTTKDWITYDGNWDKYIYTKEDVIPIYKKLIDSGIRILIFYGDTDTAVPYNGGEKWVTSLDLEYKENWRAWTLDGATRVAGYIIRYEKDFTYLTIRGAGHMVPKTKPEAALAAFENFVFSRPYLNYLTYT